jgi:hypothetical protein
MATNLRAPVTEDIWHLSIDDLLSPLPEKPRLGGPGPFVINLSSSTAGIGLPTLNLAGCEGAHAYEIQRSEDGRTRYRLRLGPFETEEEADLLLAMVREIYPSALTATAAPDDLKTIASIRAKAAAAAEARRPAPPKKPEPPVVTTRAEPVAPQPAAVSKPQVAATPPAAPKTVVTPPLAAAAKPQVAATPPAAPKPVVTPQPAAPQPAVLDEPVSFNVDISFADFPAPKAPEPPLVTIRAEAPLRTAVTQFVEPPVVTERVELKNSKPAPAPAPRVVTVRAPVAPAAVVAKPVAAVVAAAPAVTPAPVVIAAAPAVPTAPVIAAAAASVAASPASPVKKAASIWSSLPVAPRSTVNKPQDAAGRPSMSVSAPLVRRPAAPGAAAGVAKAAAPAKAPVPPKPPAAPVTATVPAKPAMAAAKPATTVPAVTAAPKTTPAQKHAVAAHNKHPTPPAKRGESHISLESTQTMRALTSAELEDENALPWFVIELATASEAFDPDTVPNLDIFAEYRLYSVAEVGKSDIVHALRVGFFSAEIAAKAVASYLAEYYDKPTIKRVSLAERERFADQAVEARKDVGATGRHAVIEITDDLIARRKRSSSHIAPP